jgi:hypothetical protein
MFGAEWQHGLLMARLLGAMRMGAPLAKVVYRGSDFQSFMQMDWPQRVELLPYWRIIVRRYRMKVVYCICNSINCYPLYG